MAELAKRFPPGIAYSMHYDTTRFVSAAMRDVVLTLAEALALVVLVVYIFLQSWRTTFIPMIAIPVSLIATLAVMEAVGFSLNMLSLLGMVLAIGLVVDDAIVVVENVERQLEAGLAPMAAARKAMSEVTGPIIATTAVLMAVFVPVAFIPGVSGRLYNQFALTVAISVGISAFNSLTLSPALAAAFLRHRPEVTFPPFRWFNRGFERLSHGYANAVSQFIRHRWILLGVFVVGLAAVFALSRVIPSTFVPVEDQGYFFVVIQGPDGASLERTDAIAKKVRDILEATPGVEIAGFISGLNFLTNAAQSNSAVEFAILKPWDQRGPAENASRIVSSVRYKLLGIPEAFVLSFDPPSIQGLGATGGFEFEVEDLAGRGSVALNDATQALIARGAQAAGAQSAAIVHDVFDLDAAVQIRPRPLQGEAARPEPARRVQHVADLSRLALRQRLQPVRPHLPRHVAGRQERARFRCPISRASMFATPSGGMVPLEHAGHSAADRRTRDRAALQQLRLGPDQRRPGAGLQFGSGGGGDAAGRRRRRCRATSATNGPASPIRS